MGIGFVLLIWIVLLLGLSALGALVMRATARHLLFRSAEGNREKAINVGGQLPFFCFAWVTIVFILQATVNSAGFHLGFDMGDSWTQPLPGGDILLMVDNPDLGTIYNPKTQFIDGGIAGDQNDAVADVSQLQLAGRYILGARKPVGVSGAVPGFFLLDTKAGHRQDFANAYALHEAVRPLGIQIALEPTWAVYARYRFTWIDVLANMLLLLPPIAAAIVWLGWVLRLRSRALTASTT